MVCTNCGYELAPDVKFCSNCGAPVNTGASLSDTSETDRERERRADFENAWGTTPSSDETTDASLPADVDTRFDASDDDSDGTFAERKAPWELEREQVREQPVDEWSMFDLGPPKPKRRRTWLWVLLGLMAVTIIACCVFGWWLSTDSGTEWFEGIATQAAEEIQSATETAATPEP